MSGFREAIATAVISPSGKRASLTRHEAPPSSEMLTPPLANPATTRPGRSRWVASDSTFPGVSVAVQVRPPLLLTNSPPLASRMVSPSKARAAGSPSLAASANPGNIEATPILSAAVSTLRRFGRHPISIDFNLHAPLLMRRGSRPSSRPPGARGCGNGTSSLRDCRRPGRFPLARAARSARYLAIRGNRSAPHRG